MAGGVDYCWRCLLLLLCLSDLEGDAQDGEVKHDEHQYQQHLAQDQPEERKHKREHAVELLKVEKTEVAGDEHNEEHDEEPDEEIFYLAPHRFERLRRACLEQHSESEAELGPVAADGEERKVKAAVRHVHEHVLAEQGQFPIAIALAVLVISDINEPARDVGDLFHSQVRREEHNAQEKADAHEYSAPH